MLGTRAVSVVIAPGTEPSEPCPNCRERVRFKAREKQRKVIANVYGRDGDETVWDHVEEWHAECYEIAGQPHGPAVERKAPQTAGRRPKAGAAA